MVHVFRLAGNAIRNQIAMMVRMNRPNVRIRKFATRDNFSVILHKDAFRIIGNATVILIVVHTILPMRIRNNAIRKLNVYRIKVNVWAMYALIRQNFAMENSTASTMNTRNIAVSWIIYFDFVFVLLMFTCFVENGSAKCAALNCAFNCAMTPVGPKCYCALGQEPNGTKCQGKLTENLSCGMYVCLCFQLVFFKRKCVWKGKRLLPLSEFLIFR